MTRSSRSTDIFQSYDFSALRLSVSCYYLKKTWMYSARVKRYQIAVLDWILLLHKFYYYYYYYFFWPRYSIPEEWKNYAMQYKKVQKSSWNEPYSSSSITKQSCSKMALYHWIKIIIIITIFDCRPFPVIRAAWFARYDFLSVFFSEPKSRWNCCPVISRRNQQTIVIISLVLQSL